MTPENSSAHPAPADLAIVNGHFWTVEYDSPWAEAIAIKDGVFAYVGSEKGVAALVGEGTRVIDVDGHFGLPAFNDCHVHFNPSMGADALRFGITTLQDVTLPESIPIYADHFQREAQGIRLHLRPPLQEVQDLSIYSELAGSAHGQIKVTGVKAYADGRLSDGTALMYERSAGGSHDIEKRAMRDWNFLKARMTCALDLGLGISTHAMGDMAVHLVLDLYEDILKNREMDAPKVRIAHAPIIAPEDMARFGEMGVVAEVNPFQRLAKAWLREKVGEAARWSFPFRSLIDNGAIICFGSDHPGYSIDNPFPLNPLLSIYAATLRFDEKDGSWPWQTEEITRKEAVEAFTINAAYAAGEEETLGSLKEGKRADIIILSENIFEVSQCHIPDVEVLLTIADGEVVHANDHLPFVGPMRMSALHASHPIAKSRKP